MLLISILFLSIPSGLQQGAEAPQTAESRPADELGPSPELVQAAASQQEPAPDAASQPQLQHAFADNGGVKLHYVTCGEGPLVVLLHGFPDYWYTWRDVIHALVPHYRIAAMDLRGYNRSGQPQGTAAYAFPLLLRDVDTVIEHAGYERAYVVGHDWGAAIAWQFAMRYPDRVQGLVILSVPHPAGFMRELATNDAQRADSQYARDFQDPRAHEKLTPEGLALWVKDPEVRTRYVEAFRRSSLEGMLQYYRANYPSSTPPKKASNGEPSPQPPVPTPSFPRIGVPVFVLHGLQDRALHAAGHNDTWKWIDAETSLLMIPDAGHFLQQDRPRLVSRSILDWLQRVSS